MYRLALATAVATFGMMAVSTTANAQKYDEGLGCLDAQSC